MGLPSYTVAPNVRKRVREVHATVRRLTDLDAAAAEGFLTGTPG
jgi:hypothetical protein